MESFRGPLRSFLLVLCSFFVATTAARFPWILGTFFPGGAVLVRAVLYFVSAKESGRSEFQRSGLAGKSGLLPIRVGSSVGSVFPDNSRAGTSGASYVTGEKCASGACGLSSGLPCPEAARYYTLNTQNIGCF